MPLTVYKVKTDTKKDREETYVIHKVIVLSQLYLKKYILYIIGVSNLIFLFYSQS